MHPTARALGAPVFILLGLLLDFSLRLHAEEQFSFEKTPGKLPKHVLPRHYEIHLKPNLEKLTLSGRTLIDVAVTKPTTEIVLNAADLEISSARLTGGSPLQVKLDPTNQLATLTVPNSLPPGKYQLDLAYTGKITESPAGMFIIDYSVPSGKKKMFATQFEATDARRVFPCFDEPAFRSTFTVIAEVPETLQAVSNMPMAKSKPASPGWKEVQFQPTPSMPTYLLVLVAGELEEIHDRVGKVETRVWFTEGKREQARYALECSKRLLTFYNDYFGIRFPLPKLDHIALPSGFGGAMEHWGAITYNEGTILYDPAKSGHEDMEGTFGIIAHEMAHQWFGNLVTMAWWDNLWLNEGFASWMAAKAGDTLNPDWNVWVRAESGKPGLMARDARKSTHPIQRALLSESQIGDAFDDITYGKGMFFIRMLEDYLGEKDFRAGLRRYMKRHAYGNTTTADLWAALEQSSHKPVAAFSAVWTEQPGLPIILATARCADGKQEIELKQERFTLLDPGAAPLRWKVPVSMLSIGPESSKQQVLVSDEPTTVKLGSCEDAIKLNAGNRGYYRVAYDRPMFERLKGRWTSLNESDRVSVLGDAWAMLQIGKLSAQDYLDLLSPLSSETSLAVWEPMIGTLKQIDTLLKGAPFQSDFRKKVISLLRAPMARLGYATKQAERPSDGVLRSRFISLLGTIDDPEVLAEIRQRYESFLQDESVLTGDLRRGVLSIIGLSASRADYDELLRRARAANQEDERQVFLWPLTQARDPELARRILDLALSKDFPPVESARLVGAVSHAHPQAAWAFMRQHHRELLALVDGPFRNAYLASTVSGFDTDSEATEFLDFVRMYHPDALPKAEEAADRIRYSAFLKRQILPSLEKWSKTSDLR